MNVNGRIMMRVMLNRYHNGAAGTLLNCLPQDEIKQILSVDVQTQEVKAAVTPLETALERIHYSWFLSPVEQLPASLQPYALAALSEEQAQHLLQLMKREKIPVKLSRPVKNYFLQFLYQRLGAAEHLPPAYIPQTILSALLTLSKQELVTLIDMLGIHDATAEVRQMVDKQQLRRFYSCLSGEMQQYLRRVLHQPDKWPSQSLGLDQWDGNRFKLMSVLHRRGLVRLAKALSGQHPDLIWHLSHHLDTGRAAMITKFHSQEEVPNVTSSLIMQVGNAITFLHKTKKLAT